MVKWATKDLDNHIYRHDNTIQDNFSVSAIKNDSELGVEIG